MFELTVLCRENWQIGPETSERAANVLNVLYKNEVDGHVQSWQSHRDIGEYTLDSIYYLHDTLTVLVSTNHTYGIYK